MLQHVVSTTTIPQPKPFITPSPQSNKKENHKKKKTSQKPQATSNNHGQPYSAACSQGRIQHGGGGGTCPH